MPKYRIFIRESVSKHVIAEPDTKEKAITGIREKFENGEITLDKENDTYSFEMQGDEIKGAS